jgi:16S rRNA (guanine527-N7)-methyltransferase
VAPRNFRTRLSRRAEKAGVFLADGVAEQLAAYHDLLFRWNRKVNLTSLDNPDEAIDRLLLEPLLAARYLPGADLALMDVGSGGGSPAIPLKIVLPKADLTMVESKARKAAFLREAIRHLGLAGAQVETSRFEELLARPALLEGFDALTVRAVRVEPRTLHTLQAFLRPGGQILMFRGQAGPDLPDSIVPPLEWMSTQPLLESLQSRLTILGKRKVMGTSRSAVFHVEH